MSKQNPMKLEPRALDIIEAEGLAPALNAIGAVLYGEGKGKYPLKNWKRVDYNEHQSKCMGHISTPGIDAGSGQPHTANGAARLLFLLQMELEGQCRS